ncbi:MAG: PAS domain S-box protein, partial [Erysipelothrix sp.]|nr:PAS domain S-box protein [Erysipelothrix sp.]
TRFIENAIVAVTTQITQQVFYYSDRFAGHFQMVFIPYDARSFIVSFNDVTVQFLKATEKEVLLSAINNIIVEYDEDLVILNIYDGDSSMFYLPKSKVIGKKITDLFPSEFAGASINSLLKAKATNKVQQLVLPSPIPFDDRIFLYQHQYVSVNNHHRFLTTGMDITKEVRINEQLKAQSEQLEKFFSVNVDMLAIIDRFGKFLRVNKVWESILEYPISDLVDASMYDFMHPDDVAFTQKQIQRLDQHEIVHEFINRFKTKSGAYRYFEWRASFGDDYLYGAARDITDQKNLQKKLQYQVDLFEIAIEGSDTGVWEYNLERNSIYFSKRWKLMLGYEDDELENNFNNFVNLVYQADRDFVLSQRDLLESGDLNKYDIEFSMYHKDGSPIWVRSKAHGVYDEQGKLLRMVGSHENITKAKEDNLALVQTFNRMQELSKQGRIIMWDIDALGTIQYVNAMFETVLGYDLKSVLHTKMYVYFID